MEDTPAEPVYLQLGSSGAEVAKLQQRLAELGYFNDGATEYFGEYTAECLKAFQAKAGSEATGILEMCIRDSCFFFRQYGALKARFLRSLFQMLPALLVR